jgi:hypothetical protein
MLSQIFSSSLMKRLEQGRVHVPGKPFPFQPGFIVTYKARILLKMCAPEGNYTHIGSCPASKYYARLKSLASNKHSSLFWLFTKTRKMFFLQ